MNQFSVMASRGRPGTKRGAQGTQMGTQQNGQAIGPPTVGLNTDVHVSYRPVTSQGLSGMQTRPLGPSRQIADKSYWLKILRDKVTEISAEIKNMQQEALKHQSDNQSQTQMERRYEETIKEVRSLEGKLADFNLALDKLRTNTDITEIKDTHDQLRFDNERDRRQIDALFIESKKCAEDTARMEAKIQGIQRRAVEQMEKLGPNFQDDYDELRRKNQEFKTLIDEKEEYLDGLDRKVEQARAKLKSAEFKRHERGVQLQKRLQNLRSQENELLEEARAKMSPEEMKQKLLRKVKATNAEIASLKREIKKVKNEVQQAEEDRDKARKDLDGMKTMKEKNQKYEQLYERDDRITKFLDTFPQQMEEAKREISRHQDVIVALMTHMSKGIKWESKLKSTKPQDMASVYMCLGDW